MKSFAVSSIVGALTLGSTLAHGQLAGKYYDTEYLKGAEQIAQACVGGSDTIVEFNSRSIDFHENSCKINIIEAWPQSNTTFDYFVRCTGGGRKTRLIIEKTTPDRIWIQWDDNSARSKTAGAVYQKCPTRDTSIAQTERSNVQQKQIAQPAPRIEPSKDNTKEAVISIYQHYLILKGCEQRAGKPVGLDRIREKLKVFDQSLRAKGLNPDALYSDAQSMDPSPAVKAYMNAIDILSLPYASSNGELFQTCLKIAEIERTMLDMTLPRDQTRSDQDNILKKDF
jgi:hypothetical protein